MSGLLRSRHPELTGLSPCVAVLTATLVFFLTAPSVAEFSEPPS